MHRQQRSIWAAAPLPCWCSHLPHCERAASLQLQRAEGLPYGAARSLPCRLARAIEVKDPERTSIRVSNVLERVAALELLQAS